ncbi:MAG: glutathione S-transferase family protein [Proteobacteria bacterium]|nr:glutathione S-transferase family protein [Pseudomonadota bacterium]MBS0549293.1 glutathione S-transferase family protein [Pseudomonadota bacterium]
MELYVTATSPYARLARTVVLEKGLQDRVRIVTAQTRVPDSPYYKTNPSGRVPYLIDDSGAGMEDSAVICAYLDNLDGQPRLHRSGSDDNWAYGRLEARTRSLCDGVSVWVREMRRPENERSPGILAHEAGRGQRMAAFFEEEVSRSPLLQGPPTMAHLVLAVALDFARDNRFGDLTEGRPGLGAWLARMQDLPSLKGSAFSQGG